MTRLDERMDRMHARWCMRGLDTSNEGAAMQTTQWTQTK